MYLQEIPLAIFTLLVQWAMGIVLLGQCLLRRTEGPLRGTVRSQSVLALVLFAIATLITFFHVGTPLHGPFTIFNLASSWLSREIAMVILTGLALLWLAWMRFKAQESSREGLAALLSIVAGLILIFVMSQIYNRPTIPGWNNPSIFPSFLASLLLLGPLWLLVVLSVKQPVGDGWTCGLSCLVLAALAGLILLGASLPLAMPYPTTLANPTTIEALPQCLAWAHAGRAVLSGLGVLLATWAVLSALRGTALSLMLTVPAFALVLAGEVIGRLAFYASYFRLGM